MKCEAQFLVAGHLRDGVSEEDELVIWLEHIVLSFCTHIEIMSGWNGRSWEDKCMGDKAYKATR
jgi:hypothetical protein